MNPICVKHTSGWCATLHKKIPDSAPEGQSTVCNCYVAHPLKYKRRKPTCTKCLDALKGKVLIDINKREQVVLESGAEFDDMLFLDGFDEALIGSMDRFGGETVALYDRDKILDILMERDGMSREDAIEFFDFNIIGAYVGEHTPAFASLLREE